MLGSAGKQPQASATALDASGLQSCSRWHGWRLQLGEALLHVHGAMVSGLSPAPARLMHLPC
jgi:hypothetical protein